MSDPPHVPRDSNSLARQLVRSHDEEPGDLPATLRRISRIALEVFAADFCIIFAVDPITRTFRGPVISGDPEAKEGPSLSPPREQGLARTVLKEVMIVVEDLAEHPEYSSEFSRSKGIRSFAALALRTMRRQRPLAVLYLDSRTPGHFGPKDLSSLEDLANHASRHLQNTWFLARNQAVAKAGQEINQRRFSSDRLLFDTLSPHLSEIIDTSHLCLLALRDRRTELVDLFIRRENQTGEVLARPVEGAWSWLLARDRSVLVRNLSEEGNRFPVDLGVLPGIASEPRPESLLFVPLLFEGKPLGLLSVQCPSPWAYEDEDRQILELLANHVALTLNNRRLFEDLQRLKEAGETLTQNLESEEVLQRVADIIRETTVADLVLLYPYLKANESFDLPPRRSGHFQFKTSSLHSQFVRPDDIAALAIRKREPTFAADSRTLYSMLEGDIKLRRGNFEVREGIRSVAAVPLRVGGEPVGVLFVNFRTVQSFDESQQQMLGGLASYAAIAIKNAREFGTESRRHIAELETLQAIDRELSRFDNLNELLQKILKQGVAQVRMAETASVLLYNPRRQELKIEAAIGARQEVRTGILLPLDGRGITVLAFKKRLPLLASDVSAPEWQNIFLDTGVGTRSELDVPLIDGENALGVLNFGSSQVSAFKDQDVRFLSTLAGQAVLAVRQAQALETQSRLAEEGQTLIGLGKELTRQLDVKRVLGLIVDRALELTRATAGTLMLLDTDRSRLVAAAEHSTIPSRPLDLDKGIVGLVARQETKLNVADVTEPPWNEIYIDTNPGTRSELAVPLLAGAELKGVLNIESPDVNHFSEHHERMIAALADFAVIALQNAERYQRAEKRRITLRALHEEAHKVKQQPDDLGLVMRAVVEHALKLIGGTQVDLDLYEGGRLTTTYQIREGVDSFKSIDLTEPGAELLPLGITQYVATTRRPYRVHGDAAEDPLFKGDPRIHSELAVPLLKGSGELIGILNVESRKLDAFDDDDQEALELYAAQAVVAIENTRNFAQAQRERQRFFLLLEASQKLERITQFEQLEEAYDIVLRIATAQYRSQVVIRRFDEDAQELVLVLAAKMEPAPFERIPLTDSLNGWVARNRWPLVVPDAAEPPPELGSFKRSNPEDRAFVVVPIQFDRSYYGNLALSHEKPYYFQHVDLKLLGGLAQQLAFTLYRLEEVRAHQEAEQRAKEAEVMSRVGHQAYEIAHRMGNEFGPVLSYVRRIREALHKASATDPKVEGYLEEISSSAEWLLTVSERLQAESSHFAEPSLVPVRELIAEAVDALHLEEKNRRIKLERDISPEVGKVFIDHDQITAALRNLLDNAVESMPDGGRLTVGAANAGRRGRPVRIWIRDTGCGIAQEDLKKIFNLFYSTKAKNRGFGLWSVQGNVKAQGGNVVVESELVVCQPRNA